MQSRTCRHRCPRAVARCAGRRQLRRLRTAVGDVRRPAKWHARPTDNADAPHPREQSAAEPQAGQHGPAGRPRGLQPAASSTRKSNAVGDGRRAAGSGQRAADGGPRPAGGSQRAAASKRRAGGERQAAGSKRRATGERRAARSGPQAAGNRRAVGGGRRTRPGQAQSGTPHDRGQGVRTADREPGEDEQASITLTQHAACNAASESGAEASRSASSPPAAEHQVGDLHRAADLFPSAQ